MTSQSQIIRHLLDDERYLRAVLPFLEKDYFDEPHGQIFGGIAQYVQKYNRIPNTATLTVDLSELRPLSAEQREILSHMTGDEIVTYPDHIDWYIDQTETWCRNRAIENAVTRAIGFIEKRDQEGQAAIPELLRRALAVEFRSDLGHSYTDGIADRWDHYNRDEKRIPFDIAMLNTVTAGGLPAKTLNVVISGPGGGKSLFMCHCAAANLNAGYNVLYVTLEMSEYEISRRIDAHMLNMPIGDMRIIRKEDYVERLTTKLGHRSNRLMIKEYPTGQGNVNDFRGLLSELRVKADFVPDILYLDYLNICSSTRISANSSGTYQIVKAISEEVRGMAVEHDIPVVTGSQLNRDGYKHSRPDMSHVAESFGIAATADFIISLVNPADFDEEGEGLADRVVIGQIKNRLSNPHENNKFSVGFDRIRMKMFNLSEQPPLY